MSNFRFVLSILQNNPLNIPLSTFTHKVAFLIAAISVR